MPSSRYAPQRPQQLSPGSGQPLQWPSRSMTDGIEDQGATDTRAAVCSPPRVWFPRLRRRSFRRGNPARRCDHPSSDTDAPRPSIPSTVSDLKMLLPAHPTEPSLRPLFGCAWRYIEPSSAIVPTRRR